MRNADCCRSVDVSYAGQIPRNIEPGAEDPSDTRIVESFLSPVQLAALHIDGNSNAPASDVCSVCFTLAGLNQSLKIGAVEIGTHHTHSLAIAPVEPAVVFI